MPNYPNVPATNVVAITKSDSTDLTSLNIRGLYIGGAGDVAVIAIGDSSAMTFVGMNAGDILPVSVKKVMAATTATNILGLI